MKCPYCKAPTGFRDLIHVDLREMTCRHCSSRVYFALSYLALLPGVVLALFGLSRFGALQMAHHFVLPAYIFLSIVLLAFVSLRLSAEPGTFDRMNLSGLHRIHFIFSIAAACIGLCLISQIYAERIPDRADLVEKSGVVESTFSENGVIHYLELEKDPNKLKYLIHDRFPEKGTIPKGLQVGLTVDRFPSITGESYRIWEIRSGNTVLLSFEDQCTIRRYERKFERQVLLKYLAIAIGGFLFTSWLLGRKVAVAPTAQGDGLDTGGPASRPSARFAGLYIRNRKKCLAISAVIAVALGWYFTYRISDREAVQKATEFQSRIEPGTSLSWQASHFEKSNLPLPLVILSFAFHLADAKSVIYTTNGVPQRAMSFGRDRDIKRYFNFAVREAAFKRYKIIDDTLPPGGPPALDENTARVRVLGYAQRIGIPGDFQLSKMSLDLKDNKTWRAIWLRKLNGFPYYNNEIVIDIMAFDGELYFYEKEMSGEPCPTDVKVAKDDAVAKGWDIIDGYLPHSLTRDTLKKEYPIKSAELQIVQPNAVFGWIVPFWKQKKSRLAWVLTYNLSCPTCDMSTWSGVLKQHGDHDKFIVEIDASTKEFLGGDNEPGYNP